MAKVLHITADFPDSWSARKTEAVRNLVGGSSSSLVHSVYSINRLSGLGGVRRVDRISNVTTLTYNAPPYGVLLERYLAPVANFIINDCKKDEFNFDIVHAHKLTIEGILAKEISNAFGRPFICSIRGNTDQRYIRVKFDKRAVYRSIAESAAALLPTTPWIQKYVTESLSIKNARFELLPTITKSDYLIAPRIADDGFATAFHLDGWRLKGMPNLLQALFKLKKAGTTIQLDILGRGTEKATRDLQNEIDKHGLKDSVSLIGEIPHIEIQNYLNNYAGFVLPTLRESFGMVYIEALFAGVPILYSEGRGIDGFFNSDGIGVRCNPASVSSICDGLLKLRDNSRSMKEIIRRLQEGNRFDMFRRKTICETYTEIIRDIVSDQRGISPKLTN